MDVVVRIWDCVLAEGWCTVFRVALAVLRHQAGAGSRSVVSQQTLTAVAARRSEPHAHRPGGGAAVHEAAAAGELGGECPRCWRLLSVGVRVAPPAPPSPAQLDAATLMATAFDFDVRGQTMQQVADFAESLSKS